MQIAVINKRRHPEEHALAVYVGRPSPLGNSFKMSKTMGREDMIARYALWLDEELAWPDSAVTHEDGATPPHPGGTRRTHAGLLVRPPALSRGRHPRAPATPRVVPSAVGLWSSPAPGIGGCPLSGGVRAVPGVEDPGVEAPREGDKYPGGQPPPGWGQP